MENHHFSWLNQQKLTINGNFQSFFVCLPEANHHFFPGYGEIYGHVGFHVGINHCSRPRCWNLLYDEQPSYIIAVHMIKAILFTKTKNPMRLLYYVAYHYLSHDFPVANHKHSQLSFSTAALFIQW